MNLAYDLSAEDYRVAQHFSTKLQRRRSKGRELITNIAIWFAVTIGLTFFFQSAPPRIIGILLDFAAVIVFGTLAVFATVLWVLRKLRRKQIDSLAPFPIAHTLTLHPAGMSVENRFCDARYTWIALVDVEQLPAHVGVVFRAGSVMVVPNHAFASQETRDDFIGALRAGLLQAAA